MVTCAEAAVNMPRAAVHSHVHAKASSCLPPLSANRLPSAHEPIRLGDLCWRCWGAEEKGLCQSRTLWGKAALKFIQRWSTRLNTDQRTGPILQHHSGKKGDFSTKVSTLAGSIYTYKHKTTSWMKAAGEKNKKKESWKGESGRKCRAWDPVIQGCCVSDVVLQPW